LNSLFYIRRAIDLRTNRKSLPPKYFLDWVDMKLEDCLKAGEGVRLDPKPLTDREMKRNWEHWKIKKLEVRARSGEGEEQP
jgi:hypothetical protein